MNHSPLLWQAPPHSTHLTPPNHRRWPRYLHNVDKQWQLPQTEGHLDGRRSNEILFWKEKWQICVCSEDLKETEKRSCWDVSAEFLPSQEGMKLVKWSFGLVTTLSWQKEILSANISVSVHVCLSLSRSHIHILVLFHSKCVSHGSRCWNSLSDPFPPPLVPLFPLSSPFLDIFKRMWRDKRVHTERKWWLLKQSCVPWDYRDFVVIRKESKGNRSAFEISL